MMGRRALEPSANQLAPPGPAPTSRRPAIIHVFSASLTLTPERVEKLAGTLSPDEQARASHSNRESCPPPFHRRARHPAHCSWLLLGLPDRRALRSTFSPRGKPSLAGTRALHFNLAHSGDLALIAVTRLCPLGVDVEHLRAVNDAEAIARPLFFPARKRRAARRCLPALKTAAFFNLWTRKEAWLKATGEGIGDSLHEVEVSFQPGEPARLVSLFGNAAATRLWTLCALDPAEEFIGALAALGG